MLLHMHGLQTTGDFPTFISPSYAITPTELPSLLHNNLSTLQQLLLKRGGLVFRGFPVHTANDFANFIQLLRLGNFVNYIGGDSPRDKVEQQVYTSTEAPPNLHIPLHQELSFIKNAPKHIYFYCAIAPQQGGETIIADARKIYHCVNPLIRERFISNGLTYISHYYYKSKIMKAINRWQRSHKSWIEVFETEDKTEVEQKCQLNDFTYQWFKHDWLQIKQTRPATLQHPITMDRVWFNQAHLYDFNPRLLGYKRYLGAKLFYIRPSTRLHEIRYANGTRIARHDLYHIFDVLEQHTVKFPWQQGDVMVLDNILSMHGRAPFQGQRRILTALTA